MKGKLQVNFLSYWHVGSGLSGTLSQGLVVKDRWGLPYFPGKSLKGVLRQAINLAGKFGWLDDYGHDIPLDAFVFGSELGVKDEEGVFSEFPALLQVSDACLKNEEQSWIIEEIQKGKDLSKHFYRVHYFNAVNTEKRVAEKNSVRVREYTIPLTLQSELELNYDCLDDSLRHTHKLIDEIVFGIISKILPLVDTVGRNRNRGYGRVQMELLF